MTPKVYGIGGSPPYAAVLTCAKVLGLEVETVSVSLIKGEHLKEDFIKKNPQHTVPILEEDDGFILPDSHTIMAYLVGKYGKEEDTLYPKKDLRRKALIDYRLHLDFSVLAARGFLISRPLALEGVQPDQKLLDLLNDGFSILDKLLELQNTKYIVDDKLSIADFSITITVTAWEFFLPNYEKDYPHIKAYIDRMKKEDWFDVYAEGKQGFHALFDKLWQRK